MGFAVLHPCVEEFVMSFRFCKVARLMGELVAKNEA